MRGLSFKLREMKEGEELWVETKEKDKTMREVSSYAFRDKYTVVQAGYNAVSVKKPYRIVELVLVTRGYDL